ncbi:Nucleotidyltransferase [Lentinula detonsa]|uniref:Nucleotidyltransferase n=1 Tax=Lentinula detonsa TaxID=2804962 RepID=A0A9W8TTD2_9AGAR|nr:Nucleotidyltransferase [Lentinula detonsa]
MANSTPYLRNFKNSTKSNLLKMTIGEYTAIVRIWLGIRALRAHPTRIKSLEDAQKIPGIGKKTAQKHIKEQKTARQGRLNLHKNLRCRIQTATMWYARGCRTIEDLCNGLGDVTLNEGQKIGIKFYDDLNSRMPREEAKAIFELIKPIALRIDPKLVVEIMGSYRRGKADCGDIDILITLCPLIILNHSKLYIMVFAAFLMFQGDDMFNRSMRLLANKMGYSLNQRGLYAGVVRDPRNRTVKLNTGNLITSETEVEIFKALGVPWREPHERVTYYQDIAKAEVKKKMTNAP